MATDEREYAKPLIAGFIGGILLLIGLLVSHFNYYDLGFLVVVLYRFIKYLWIRS